MGRQWTQLWEGLIDYTVETKYTVPANTRTLLRSFIISNPLSRIVQVTVVIGGNTILNAFPIPAQANGSRDNIFEFNTPIVLNAAETVTMMCDDTSDDDQLTTMGAGEELTLG